MNIPAKFAKRINKNLKKNKWGTLAMSLIFITPLISCPNDTTTTTTTTTTTEAKNIDSRLVGGKWYDGASGTSNSYYKFTEDTFIAATNGVSTEISTPAYTNNGKVLATDTDTVIMTYVFVQASEYDDEVAAAQTVGDEISLYKWRQKQAAAAGGNMVRFTTAGGVTVEWARWENVQ